MTLGHTEASKRPCRVVWLVERSHLASPPFWRPMRREAPGRGLMSTRLPPLSPWPPLPPSCPLPPQHLRPSLLPPRQAKRCQDCWTRQSGTAIIAAPAGVHPRWTIPRPTRTNPYLARQMSKWFYDTSTGTAPREQPAVVLLFGAGSDRTRCWL
jgi:hypothetical protein